MIHRLRLLLIYTAMLVAMPSCGLLELDPDALPEDARELLLNRDTAYVMLGDTLDLRATVEPDQSLVSSVFWYIEDPDVVQLQDDKFIAVGQGTTLITALYVRTELSDSCLVSVLPRWEASSYDYAYETIIRARVTVHGQPMAPHMKVAALCHDQIRGVGHIETVGNQSYLYIRVGADQLDSGNEEDEDWIREMITFQLYDPTTLRMQHFPQTLPFDGENHGTLTHPFELTIE